MAYIVMINLLNKTFQYLWLSLMLQKLFLWWISLFIRHRIVPLRSHFGYTFVNSYLDRSETLVITFLNFWDILRSHHNHNLSVKNLIFILSPKHFCITICKLAWRHGIMEWEQSVIKSILFIIKYQNNVIFLVHRRELNSISSCPLYWAWIGSKLKFTFT